MKNIASIIIEGAATVEDAIITDKLPSSNGVKARTIAEGTLQDMNVENRNHRIYESKDLAPEINSPRIKELLAAGYLRGEAGHPLSNDLARQQTIEPKNVCVQFMKVWIDGNKIKARFKGTQNSHGDLFDSDLKDGCKPAFSLRALGSIEDVNGKAYVRGPKIITWDHVIFPSHKVAYTEKIVSENAISTEYKLNENQIFVPNNDPGMIMPLNSTDASTFLSRVQRESANMDTVLNIYGDCMDSINVVNESSIMLSNRFGERIVVNTEAYIRNLIMEYAMSL